MSAHSECAEFVSSSGLSEVVSGQYSIPRLLMLRTFFAWLPTLAAASTTAACMWFITHIRLLYIYYMSVSAALWNEQRSELQQQGPRGLIHSCHA
jgi:hypothetical protein